MFIGPFFYCVNKPSCKLHIYDSSGIWDFFFSYLTIWTDAFLIFFVVLGEMEQNTKNNTDAAPTSHGNVNPRLATFVNPTTLSGSNASGSGVGFTRQAMSLRRQGRPPNPSNLPCVLDLPAPRALAGLSPLYPPSASTK